MYKRKAQGWMKHLDFVLLDLICMELSVAFAHEFYFGWLKQGDGPAWSAVAVLLAVLDFSIIAMSDAFKGVLRRGPFAELKAIVKQVALVFMGLTLYWYLAKVSGNYSRITIVTTAVAMIALSLPVRQFWKRYLKRGLPHAKRQQMLLITTRQYAQELAARMEQRAYEQYAICGVALVDENAVGQRICDVPVVADGDSVVEYICREWIDEVLVALDDETLKLGLMKQIGEMGVTMHVCMDSALTMPGRKQFYQQIGEMNVLTTSVNYASPVDLALKRLMDIAGGLVGSLIAGVAYLFIAPAIRRESPGPVFFKQTRIGKNGKRIQIMKFRSMYLDAEARKQELMAQNRVKDGMMFKLDWDPRIIGNRMLPDGTTKTGLGDFIRRTSLDELPQFFSILKGDMSLVGTRPPTEDEWEKYKLHHRTRLATKPGLTGMWQVSGRSNITDFEEVVKLDTEYIDHWSLGLDIRILFKTVGVVLKRSGSM